MTWVSDRRGLRWAIEALLVLLVAAALLAAALLAYGREVESIDRIRALASEADAQGDAAAAVLDALKDAETGQRGYLLTQREAYLPPYAAAQARLASSVASLRQLAGTSPWLVGQADILAHLADQKMAELGRTLELARAGKLGDAIALLQTDAGLATMEQVRQRVAALLVRAADERDRRQDQVRAAERMASRKVAIGTASGVAVLGVAVVVLLIGRSRRLRAQTALQMQTDRLAGTIAHIRDGLALFDRDGRLVLWNDLLFPLTGLPPTLAVVGTAFAHFSEAAAYWPGAPLAAARPDPAPTAVEVRLDGRLLEIWRGGTPDGGQILGAADITQRSEAEAVARQAYKMEALGQLTGGVAHDFNNLLQVISANLELIAGGLDHDPAMSARMDAALAGTQRAARLTRHLLAFARRQPLAPEVLDTARLLGGMGDMLHRTLGEGIAVEMVLSGGLWPIRADAQQLENAILNLAINARDAMPQGGRLTVEASNAFLDSAYVAGNPDASPGQFVMIAVTDTGTGMTPDQLAHAVEPFFTTKPEGRGTGLGLSMVYGFARQSGGHFKLYSEPGHGTTARLYAPRGDSAPASTAPQREPEPARGELVLVVEDDAAVRVAAAAALHGLGYRTLEADSAAAALALLRDGACPDLLFTDVVMPGRPGARELAAEARRLVPHLAVVFTSGYTQNAVVHNGQLDTDVILVSKPWRLSDLAPRLRAALAVSRQPARPRTLRVLLVEDDGLVRMTTADLLAELGHEVAEAATAQEALSLLAGGSADLVMTDIGLPDMDGLQLAARIRADRPGLPVVIASGRAAPADAEGLIWLPKPYDDADLRRAIAEALAGS